MDRVVVLGAGFAGLTIAKELDALVGEGKADVTLVERNAQFSMGFNMQWVLAGRRAPEEGERDYASLRPRHVRLVHDEAVAIDTAERTVRTKSRLLPYEHLVVALGAELAPELVPGLAEAAYNLCELSSMLQFRSALRRFDGGTITIAVASVPFKCPPAPYEYTMLIEDLLRERGVRERGRLVLTTPEPQPMPVAGKAVGDAVRAMLAERGIEYLPGHKPASVDAAARIVTYENGASLTYDLLAAMPPHRAPRVVRDAGLTDVSGFVPVELGTFRTKSPNVYAVGDSAAMKLPNGNPHPKAGVFAEAQALVLARNLAAEIQGGEATPYAGRGVCYIDVGRGMAASAEISLLTDSGPKALIDPPSAKGLELKRQFERERFTAWFGG